MSDVTSPPARRDAARNRELLLEAARDTFAATAAAPGGRFSMEAIARSAGVGVGTLYRHFPTREALVEEVYRTQLAAVCDFAAQALREHEPREALRLWIAAYGDFVGTKRGMAETFRAILVAGTIAPLETRQRVTAAMGELLDAGTARGDFRTVDPETVVASLVGIHLAAPSPEQAGQRAAMIELLLAGIETTA